MFDDSVHANASPESKQEVKMYKVTDNMYSSSKEFAEEYQKTAHVTYDELVEMGYAPDEYEIYCE